MKRTFYALCFITFIGAFLRIFNVGFQTLGCDELYSLMVAKRTFLDGFVFVMTEDTNPPLFYLFAHFAYIVTGFVDTAIRYPAVVFGILEIPAIFYLGRTISRGVNPERVETVGVISSAIVAILFPLVYYSQFARAYSLVVFVFTLFLIVFVNIRTAKTTDYILLGVLGGICVWCHLFVMIPVAIALSSLYFTSDRVNAIVASLPFAGAMILLIPLFFATRTTRMNEAGMVGMTPYDFAVYTPVEFFGFAFPLLFLAIIYGIYTERKNHVVLELLGIVSLSLLLGLVAAMITPAFSRYFLTLVPILVSIGACGIVSVLCMMKNTKGRIVAVGGFLLLIFLMQLGSFWAHYTALRDVC
jgi:mannosyltransferase